MEKKMFEWFEILILLIGGMLFLYLLIGTSTNSNCDFDIYEPYGKGFKKYRKVKR